MANINPLRYRGYYYDRETGFYYLQSRYYHPFTGRFISADSYASTGQGLLGFNMFAYCNNNPVNGCDPCGTCEHDIYFFGLVDCKKCRDESSANAFDRYMYKIYDYRVITDKINQQIMQEQVRIAKDTAILIIDTNAEATILQSQSSQQQAEIMSGFVYERFSTPEKASNTLNAVAYSLDVAAGYCALIAAGVSVPSLGMSAATAGSAAVFCAVASLPFRGIALLIDFLTEER